MRVDGLMDAPGLFLGDAASPYSVVLGFMPGDLHRVRQRHSGVLHHGYNGVPEAVEHQAPYSSPTANSACFSPLSNTLASWLTAVYQYQQDPASGAWKYVAIDQVSAATGATEARAPSTGSFSKMGTWYRSLMTETFS
jgi:hypothetical protein